MFCFTAWLPKTISGRQQCNIGLNSQNVKTSYIITQTINFWFAGNLLSSAALLTVCSSIFNHEAKNRIMLKLLEHDNSLNRSLNVQHLKKSEIQKNLLVMFTVFSSSSVAYLIYVYSMNSKVEIIVYGFQYVSMNHIIHVQCLQIYIFAKSVEERLRILSDLELLRNNNLHSLSCIKRGLVDLCDVVRDINECFSSSLCLIYILLYGSVISNLHWIGISLLGETKKRCEGKRFWLLTHSKLWIFQMAS